jgi:hypothetical protein
MLQRIGHNNFLAFLDYFIHEQTHYVVLEYIGLHNRSFFAAECTLKHSYQNFRSRHTTGRRIMFPVEFPFQFVNIRIEGNPKDRVKECHCSA